MVSSDGLQRGLRRSGVQHLAVRQGPWAGWKTPGRPAPRGLYDFLVTLKKDPAHEHGDIFRYQTPKTDVVNWITNRATGKSFQDLMSEVL